MTEPAVPKRGRFIPWLFVGGMLSVVVANGTLIYFATATWSGLAAPHPYEQGLAYNRALAAEAHQEKLGWTIDARLKPDSSAADLVVTATDRSGRTLDGLRIDALLERPVGEPETRKIELRPGRDGTYAARLQALPSGQWEVLLAARRGGQTMYTSQRLLLQ